ncbi:MAG: hypothetical protein LBU32_19960 [Clostridiales bacterium]|jgi:hypothetical protein|nr:hypothetical protein [Clostridiales bacterium]
MAHQFSKDYDCQKIHYFLIQIAHSIFQLLEKGAEAFRRGNATHSQIRRSILAGLSKGFTPEDIQYIINSDIKYDFLSRDPRQRAGYEKDKAFNLAS